MGDAIGRYKKCFEGFFNSGSHDYLPGDEEADELISYKK